MSQGDASATEGLRLLERMRHLHVATVVVLPFLALIAGIVLFWKKGIGPPELAGFGCMYIASALGIGVGYHRLFAHKSFRTSAPMRVLFAILGAMAAQGPVVYWVAVHRVHHENSDRAEDPHSPHQSGPGARGFWAGLWHSHIGWMFAHEIPNTLRYANDLVRDKAITKVNRLYLLWLALGLAIPAMAAAIVAGAWPAALSGLLWGGLIRIFFTSHVIWSINSVCHIFGRRPFDTHDYSTNNAWLALPSFGESWHNNHHAFPASAFHGLGWQQIDLSGLTIRLLQRLGLVWNVQSAKPRRTPAPHSSRKAVTPARGP